MLKLAALIALLGCALGAPTTQFKLYEGHQVIRVVPQTPEQVKALWNIEKHGFLVDYWIEPGRVNHPVDIRLSKEQVSGVKEYLKQNGMSHTVRLENLNSLVLQDAEFKAKRKPFKKGTHPSLITTNDYHTYEDIMAYLDEVAGTYPNLVTSVNIGRSYENRRLSAIKIGNPGSNKKAAWIDGGIHAREWVTTATVVWIINELVTNQSGYSNLLNNLDIYLMPIVNPDGYSYTWTNDRMWRKTRSRQTALCTGVDPNRNWDYQWDVAGASNNPCSETYAGPGPFSEVEPRSVADFLRANKDALKAYVNLHSYSEYFMYPYGDVQGHYPPDVNQLNAVAARAVEAIRSVNGLRFTYGSIIDVIYPASGGTIDYTKAVLDIKYSYALELRPNSNAANGFVLPPAQIIPAALETWAGLQVVLNQVIADGK